MAFEKHHIEQAAATQAEKCNQLDLNSVCPDRASAEQFNVTRPDKNLDVAQLLEINDHVVAQASNHWNNIVTKFNRLPEEYKQELLQSFAPHMYDDNENYPMYNKLVQSHAKAIEGATLV